MLEPEGGAKNPKKGHQSNSYQIGHLQMKCIQQIKPENRRRNYGIFGVSKRY